MGRTKYGDCVVVCAGGKTILIDGGHPGDYKEREDRPSIPSQLGSILESEAPFHFDLLVVTHCHSDHIGCLPNLVANGIITCDRALVADEKLGFGIDDQGEGDSRLGAVGPRVRNLVAALSEEDHADLRGAELEEFLADAASLQDNYNSMLRTLDRNADVVRYRQGTARDRSAVQAIVDDMSSSGLAVFGPTAAQLVHCAEVIQRASGDAADLVADTGDASESLADIYLRIMRGADDAADAIHHEIGWAKNCQSIVMAFGPPGERILLPGDMQFAEPGIPPIEDSVAELRRTTAAEGPYVFVKTPHHTSHNGIDSKLLEEWGWPPLVGHSGGFNDPTHPDPKTLQLLKSLSRQHDFTYVRTDHNGLVTVEPSQRKIIGERNRVNDFTPNTARDEIPAVPETAVAAPSSSTLPTASATSDGFVEITFMRIPYASGRISLDEHKVEITRAAPSRAELGAPVAEEPSRIVSERPSKDQSASPPRDRAIAPTGYVLGGGRNLQKLLFVTDRDRLRRNIGEDADRGLRMVRDAGHGLVTGAADTLAAAVQGALRDSSVKGVVVLGGYDVVPSQRVDVLGPELRARLPESLIARDRDGFIVWSDDVYGDRDGDVIPELPVSRVPDARLGSFFLKMLSAAAREPNGRFGLRNRERPFADAIYGAIPGNDPMLISEPQAPAAGLGESAARTHLYFMLHGDYRNSTVFWGEDDGGITPAIDLTSLPLANVGIAFAGCCWGALIVSEPAFLSGNNPTPRMVERSIALSILNAGARAFVGPTGVHYSPGETGDFFGGPLHAAFWDEIVQGREPAPALFNARRRYLRDIPHNRSAMWNLAVERKLYKQFTCLGLGW
jgi:beta-lactamase superfamily II metal-dependent hydrolase